MQLVGAKLPRLACYADALEYYNSVKPYNKAGRYAGMRPLGVRRYTQCLIQKQNQNIHLTLYGHIVSIFTPDNKLIISACGYHTQTTTDFLNHVCADNGALRFFTKVRKLIHACSDWYGLTIYNPLPYNKPITYDIDKKTFVNPEPIHRYRANVRETKRMLANYAPFLDYCKTAIALMADSQGRCKLLDAQSKLVEMRNHAGVGSSGNTYYTRFYNFDVFRNPEIAREHRTMFFATLDKALVDDNHAMTYLLFIRLCSSLDGFSYYTYEDMKRLFINLLKFQYPHLLFRREEVQPTTHAISDDNNVFVNYCGDKTLIEQLNRTN